MTSITPGVTDDTARVGPGVALDLSSPDRASFALQRLEDAMAGRDFEGWTVLVTGASTGLGRAIAVDCAARGAATGVINYASNAEEAAATLSLVEALGATGILAQGDVANDADCHAIVEAARDTGRI